MKLSTYLYFDGCCAEAFDFYKAVFGGDFSTRLTFADGPLDVPEADSGRIMHISLPVGDDELQGSDTVSTSAPAKPSNNFAITLRPATRGEADAIFAALMDEGEIAQPLQATFWGAYYGLGTDRFGVQWMINGSLL